MNNLLPRLDELFPITGNRNTFGESKMSRNFFTLDFITKLQIINDLVRQTMLISDIPNPKDEIAKMEGDSYTASIIAMEYLKECKIGAKYALVMALKKPFQIVDEDINNFVVLVSDDNNECYQFDCTPSIGYCHGKVQKIEDGLLYAEYYYIDENINNILLNLRQAIYDLSNMNVGIDDHKIKEYEHLIEISSEYACLKNYVLQLKRLLYKNKEEDNDNLNYECTLIQIEIWKEELAELIKYGTNLERQLELSQWITSEYVKYHSEHQKFVSIQGEEISFRKLTPRFFFENQLNCIIIKPSTFFINEVDSVRKNLIGKKNIYGEYLSVLGGRSKDGIRIMQIFHPDGYKYERSMLGICDIFLIHENAKKLKGKKMGIRTKLASNMNYKIIKWFDNKPFYWDPIIANFVHSTDNSCEVSCHYLAAYPEYQIMTRFMYPNPKLIF